MKQIFRIYDYLSTCKGAENAVSARSLAKIFYPQLSEQDGKRSVRKAIRAIRRSDVFDNVIVSSNEGYHWATEAEAVEASRRLFNQAFDMLKTAHIQAKKASKNGQTMIKLTEHQREVFESLCEVADE